MTRLAEQIERPKRYIESAQERAKAESLAEEKRRRAELKSFEGKVAECFIEPGPGRIVVVMPEQAINSGIIYVPEGKGPAATVGTILKVGVECNMLFKAPDGIRSLQPGDKVVYGTWTGTLINFDQRPAWRILSDAEILGLLTGEATKLLDVQA